MAVEQLDVDLARLSRLMRAYWRRAGFRPTLPEQFGPPAVSRLVSQHEAAPPRDS